VKSLVTIVLAGFRLGGQRFQDAPDALGQFPGGIPGKGDEEDLADVTDCAIE
jgi:hypothetical protein